MQQLELVEVMEEDMVPPSMVEGAMRGKEGEGGEREVERQRKVMVVMVGTMRGVVP
jgi:hypothetical protein